MSREIDWDVLVIQSAGPEPPQVIYEFSNGRQFTRQPEDNPYEDEDEE